MSLLNSVKVLNELKIEYDYYELSGDSYVDRAKNTLVHRFLQTDATHLFMIDSDLSWDPEGFARIIRAGLMGAEIVGGAFPNKNNWSTFGCIPLLEDGYLLGKEIGGVRLLEMWGIPGGFILYSRKAFERTRPNLACYTDPLTNETFLECFRCNIEENGIRVGEDIYFQKRYREMEGKVWLEPDINFRHFGIKGWEGNYHQFLLNTRKTPESSDGSKNIHLVMPFSRPHLKETLINGYEPMNIILHPIMTPDEDIRFDKPWIAPCIVPPGDGGNIVTWKLNNFIKMHDFVDGDYYCQMNDDDFVEEGVFDKIRQMNDDIVFVSMKRGHHTPQNVPPINRHPTYTLYAKPENVRLCEISMEQMFIKGWIYKTIQYERELPCADGRLAIYLKENYPIRYEPDLFMLFNYFEPGRWDLDES